MEIENIIKTFGGVQATATALGVSRQTVFSWRKKGKAPPWRIIQAEAVIEKGKWSRDV